MINRKRIITSFTIFILVIPIYFIFNNISIFPELNEIGEVSINNSNTLSQETYEILSISEMSILIGGCSSTNGSCLEYYHTCPDGCTHLRAKTCQGSLGTCYETGFSIVCRCDGYIFVKGCL